MELSRHRQVEDAVEDAPSDILGPAPTPADSLLQHVAATQPSQAHTQLETHSQTEPHPLTQSQSVDRHSLEVLSSYDHARRAFLTALESLLFSTLRVHSSVPAEPATVDSHRWVQGISSLNSLRRHSAPFATPLPTSVNGYQSIPSSVLNSPQCTPLSPSLVEPFIEHLRLSLQTSAPEDHMRSLGLSPFTFPSPLEQLYALISRAREESCFQSDVDAELAATLCSIIMGVERLLTIDRNHLLSSIDQRNDPDNTFRDAEKRLIWSRLDEKFDRLANAATDARASVAHEAHPKLLQTVPAKTDAASTHENNVHPPAIAQDAPPDYADLPPVYAQEAPDTSNPDESSYPSEKKSEPSAPEVTTNEKLQHELEFLTLAVERLHRLSPQMANQRVEPPNRRTLHKQSVNEDEREDEVTKEHQLSALADAVEKMQRGRMNDQRFHDDFITNRLATYSFPGSSTKLHRVGNENFANSVEDEHFWGAIQKAQARRLSNQRVEVKAAERDDEKEDARRNHIIDTLGKGRLTSQDAFLPEPSKMNTYSNNLNSESHLQSQCFLSHSCGFDEKQSVLEDDNHLKSANQHLNYTQNRPSVLRSRSLSSPQLARSSRSLTWPNSPALSFMNRSQVHSNSTTPLTRSNSVSKGKKLMGFWRKPSVGNSYEVLANGVDSQQGVIADFEYFSEERKSLGTMTILMWLKNKSLDTSKVGGWRAKAGSSLASFTSPSSSLSQAYGTETPYLTIQHLSSGTERKIPLPCPMAPLREAVPLTPTLKPIKDITGGSVALTSKDSNADNMVCLEISVGVQGSANGTRSRHDLEIVHPYSAQSLNEVRPAKFICANCRCELVDLEKSVDKFLALPSEHWAELFEAWMCHQPHIQNEDSHHDIDAEKDQELINGDAKTKSASDSNQKSDSGDVGCGHRHLDHSVNGDDPFVHIKSLAENNSAPRWPRDGEAMEAETAIMLCKEAAKNWLPRKTSRDENDLLIEDLEGPWIPISCSTCRFPLGYTGRRKVRKSNEKHSSNGNPENISFEEVIKLSKYAINPVGSLLSKKPLDICPTVTHLSAQLLDLSQARPIHRFIIRDEEDDNVQYLLWLFNPSIAAVASREINIHDMRIPPGQRFDAMKVFYRIASTPGNQDKKALDIQNEETIRRLFSAPHVISTSSSNGDLPPSKEFDIETIRWPIEVCQRFGEALKSTKYALPEFARVIGSFEVGLLPRLQATHP